MGHVMAHQQGLPGLSTGLWACLLPAACVERLARFIRV